MACHHILMTLILSLIWSAFVSIVTGLISAALYDRWRRRDAVDDLRFSTLSDMIDPLVETALLAEKWRGRWHDNPHHRDIHQYGLDAYSLGGFSAMQLLAEAAEARSREVSVGGRIDKVWSGIGIDDRRGAWLA